MSWSIHVAINTVKISKECAKELFKVQEEMGLEIWYEEYEVTDKGQLSFNKDHEEHMDFLKGDDALKAVLLKHKVSGDIGFIDVESSDVPYFWGYRFDGAGNVSALKGSIAWVPEGQAPQSKQQVAFNDAASDTDLSAVAGKTVVFTGILSTMTRKQAASVAIGLGAHVTDAVSKNTDFLVAGKDAGSKLEKASKLGVTVLSEEQWNAMIGQVKASKAGPAPAP